jgi:transposase
MPTIDDKVINILNASLPLPGRIVYDKKASGVYATYVHDAFRIDGKLNLSQLYLGKVIDKDRGIFRNHKRGGNFTFSIESGFGVTEDSGFQQAVDKRHSLNLVFDFGDIWTVDQIYKQSGLDTVLENVIPESSDTLKALVAFRLLEDKAYCYANDWFSHSYARILYPNAKVDSQRISEFHAKIGREEYYKQFFRLYLDTLIKSKAINENITIPILIDSTGLQNDINTYLTAISNHNGDINNEMRLIYVIDKDTKMPIFFRIVSGNIIDNTTFINTVNSLLALGIKIQLVIMDAGYSASNNIAELLELNIPFLTRLTKNRSEHKQLIREHGTDLEHISNAIMYGNRLLYAKKIPINMYNHQIFAYIMLDDDQARNDSKNIVKKFLEHDIDEKKASDKLSHSGKFVLISSFDLDINQVLPLYYQRQAIEQIFDISKTYANVSTLRAHSSETIRGVILICFISTIIYTIISGKLSKTKYSTCAALLKMHYLRIKMYEDFTMIEVLNKEEKDLFGYLNLDCPFNLENGTLLKKSPFLASLANAKKKKGRPPLGI